MTPVSAVTEVIGLDVPAACLPSQSYWCSLVYHWTGNETLAHIATWLIGAPLSILGIVVIGLVVRWLLHRVIDRFVARASDGLLPDRFARGPFSRESDSDGIPLPERRVQRAKTMGSLLKSVVSGTVFAIVLVIIISILGYNIGPIIAGAGIVGVALGFGSQALVKDFLSGMFMIFEDQYGVGDNVDLGEAVGIVEAVSLRVTRLRDVNGTVWYVPNGSVVRVGNKSQNWASANVDIRVDGGEDLARVQRVLREVAHEMWGDDDFHDMLVQEPEVWGVQALEPGSATVRMTVRTVPDQLGPVTRALRERVKARLDFEEIKMPRTPSWGTTPAGPTP